MPMITFPDIASARHKSSALIAGDDTDVLVLLLHHADMDAHRVFLKFLMTEQNRVHGASILFTHGWCIIPNRLFVMGKCLVVARNCVT